MSTVSIILPFRNAEMTLAAALRSLRDQTYEDWEGILVDDGSSDGSAAVARRLAEQDKRFRLVERPAEGLVAALHHGVEASEGRFLARMDADDICLPERLALQVAALREDPDVGVVSTRVQFGGDPQEQEGYAAHVDWLNGILSPEDHHRYRFVESPVAHPSVMFRREVLERHGGYREESGPEDYELWLRWMDVGVRFRKLPEVGLVWHDPPNRLSRQGEAYRVEAFYRVKGPYLRRALPSDRPVWLWGSGRVTRQRFDWLSGLGDRFVGYIDVNPRKTGQQIGGLPVISPEELPAKDFVVAGVGTRGAGRKIEAFLTSQGRRWGRDYWLAA